ncbi:hypothetical protein ACFOSC_26645 [Streptantibioticus rubrisoli]|uniref:Uncharacterized protein n=1 Tax=Streptantibioticus rubrisoli TaxID=1387313 RepID=A0ABT1PGB9_9ACTN|nr:hypothetical protein [Streptantibioticus rubrisoli]MCQ4043846.1 hypothetical protein [Streptantibioticus rubrisoli]
MTFKQELHDAIGRFNSAEIAEFSLETGTRWLGDNGPTYIVGDVRAKGLAVDEHGRHWADGALVAESLAHLTGSSATGEAYRQALCLPEVECRDLIVFTDTRGRWNALMAPVEAMADAFGYPPPARLPDGNWARTWWDLPERTDEEELAWIANGGKPLNTYRGGLS